MRVTLKDTSKEIAAMILNAVARNNKLTCRFRYSPCENTIKKYGTVTDIRLALLIYDGIFRNITEYNGLGHA